MSSFDRHYGGTLGAHVSSELSASPLGGTAGGFWIGRAQRLRGRHAAITQNLHSWGDYKTWSEQMRDSWDQGQGQGPGRGGAPKKRKKK